MEEVSIRELRNRGGEVVDRVAAGAPVIITRDGRAVAELRAVPRQPLRAQLLLQRWSHLQPVDPRAFRADIDAVLDPSL